MHASNAVILHNVWPELWLGVVYVIYMEIEEASNHMTVNSGLSEVNDYTSYLGMHVG